MAESIEPFPGPFPGSIKAPLDLQHLLGVSDLVCGGSVTRVDGEGQVQYMVRQEALAFSRQVAHFRVAEVYAGSVDTESIQIEFLRADLPSSLESLHTGEHGIVFLVRHHSRFRLADLTTSKILLGRDSPFGAGVRRAGVAGLREVLARAARVDEPEVGSAAREALATLEDESHASG
jgi:hypothetical protein